MATMIYLSNDPSDVSGYKKAYLGYPSPNASSTVSTAVTGLTASGTSIQMTATSGGSVIKWLTVPFLNDVVVAGGVMINFWGKEANAADNAQFGLKLAAYTTTEQTPFFTTSVGYELTTSVVQQPYMTNTAAVTQVNTAFTSTTISATQRLAILPWIYPSGTMGGGNAATFDYNGITAGADGDSFVELTETVEPNQSQCAAGTTPAIADGPSAMAYGDYVRQLEPVIKAITANSTTVSPQWLQLKDELKFQGNVGTSDSIQSA